MKIKLFWKDHPDEAEVLQGYLPEMPEVCLFHIHWPRATRPSLLGATLTDAEEPIFADLETLKAKAEESLGNFILKLPLVAGAQKAIRHTLRTICDDPRKFYLLGTATQTYTLLTEADAALHGQPLEEGDWQPDPERYEQFLKEREEEQEGDLGKATAPNILDAVLDSRKERILERLSRLALMEARHSPGERLISDIKDIVKEELEA